MPKTKQTSPAKYWLGTFNNYTEEECTVLVKELEQKCEKFIMQEEVGENGTPHLQMKICFEKKARPVGAFTSKKIHWELSKMWKGWEYCAKDNTHIGRRWTKGVVIPRKIEVDEPYGWQLKVVDICKKEPERRVIYWFWSPKGGVGKTELCKYIRMNFNALMVCGKASDMKCAIALRQKNEKPFPDILLMNIPRSIEHISYGGLEEIKDGIFFSGKYESDDIIMPTAHLIIFANQEPDYEKMSEDRWKVFDIRELMTEGAHEAQREEQHSLSQ